MAIPGGVKRGKPRDSAKPKKVVVPKPEVAVQAPKPRIVKVAPEVTRPVTQKQRQAIDQGTRQAATQTLARTVTRAVRKVAANKVDAGPLRVTNPAAFRAGKKPTKVASSLQGAFDVEKKVVGKVTAPGLKVLAATTIPVHAVAGAANQATGRGVRGLTPAQLLKGAKTGIKQKTTYSNVLKTAGVKNKTVRAVAGFAGDVALDPLTYTTFGTATVAKKAAQTAGEKAYQEATARGLSHVKATKAAEKIAKKAEGKAPQNKGITITVGGKSTSGKTTAAVSRKLGVSKAATKVRESRIVQGVGKDVRPDFRPKGVSKQQFETTRQAAREARAQTTRGRVHAVSKAQALKDALPKEDYARVRDAIERGTVYDLPEHLRVPARDVEQTFRRLRRNEIKAGIETPNRRRYFTHALEDVEPKKGVGGGKRVIKPAYAKGRQYQGTAAQIEAAGGPKFSADVAAVTAQRMAASSRDVAQAKFNRSLLQAGRKVKQGEPADLSEGEALFRIEGSDLKHIEPGKDEARALASDTSNLRILHKDSVEAAYKSIAPGSQRHYVGKLYDKAQGGFKFMATVPNPGFHARNLYGDTQNAYLGQPAGKLVVNLGRSAKTLHALGKEEKAARTLGAKVDPTTAGIKVKGKYGGSEFITYDKLAREAVDHGAIRSGFLSKELPELVRDTAKKVKGKERVPRLKRVIQNREDLPRLATYIGARRRGLTPREAADWASKHHFDYADLTGFERTVMRRLLPFYTFSGRNIPLQAKKLITNPGKYANVEKAREELAKSSGLPGDWQARIPEYQQRGIPFPVTIGGKVYLASPSFPLNDLNQLALPNVTTANFGSALGEQEKKFLSMLNPIIKDGPELYANYNFFFRGPIERETGPLVAAPGYVKLFPKTWRDRLGIVDDYRDPRTGKKGWGWPGKVDYVAKVIPGPTNVAQQLSTPLSNRRGQGKVGKLVSYIGGIKADPYKAGDTEVSAAYDERAKLEIRRSALRQRGQGPAQNGLKETKEYIKVRDRIKELTAVIDAQKGKKKVKRASSNPFDSVGASSSENPFDKVSSGPKNPFD